MIRVLVVDDHPLVREGLEAVLTADRKIELLGSVATIRDARSAVRRHEPDVVVADVQLSGRDDGIDLCESLRSHHPKVRTLILTRFNREQVMVRAFAAGARAFVVKNSDPEVLRFGVRTAASSGIFIDPSLAGTVVARLVRGHRVVGPYGLTQRQTRVLELLVQGMTNRQIAADLDVGEETVKTHVGMILQKLHAGDRTQAAAIAQREGLV